MHLSHKEAVSLATCKSGKVITMENYSKVKVKVTSVKVIQNLAISMQSDRLVGITPVSYGPVTSSHQRLNYS